jgi:hypothetical protein
MISFKTAKTGFIVWIAVMICVSCSNEVEINYPAMALPTVYCLIDQNSSAQFLRLGKTYSGQYGYHNQIPPADSLLLPGEKDIYIEEWKDNQVVQRFEFYKLPVIHKDTGLFPVEAIAVYQAEFQPKPETKYTLYVFFPNQNRIVSGETVVMGKTELIDPAPIYVREINFKEDRGYTLRYITAPHSGIYQGVFKIYYSESTDSDLKFKSFEIVLPIRYVTTSNFWVSQTISPGTFYNGFRNNIPVVEGVTRDLIHLDFSLYGAGEDLAYFVKAQIPTFWMNLAQYTNLDNGFGVFSSISSSTVDNIQFSSLTKHYLAIDSLTRDLNFRDPEIYSP